ncbi:MAG: ESPR domain-containing protein [Veillonella atypica]
MNKIFKVIWSKSKQCYIVVSELAKNTTGKKENRSGWYFGKFSCINSFAGCICYKWNW